MKTPKLAIIDDEMHCVESLSIQLQELFPKYPIVYKTKNAEHAIEDLQKVDVDLLFLDIEMPNLNGFQFLKNLPNINFDVVFTTAYNDYALEAFKINNISYLLKPIDEDELKTIMLKWENQQEQNSKKQNIHALLKYLNNEGFIEE